MVRLDLISRAILFLSLRHVSSGIGHALPSLSCPKGDCTLQERFQSLKDFFDESSPHNDTRKYYGVDDVKQLIFDKLHAPRVSASDSEYPKSRGVSRKGRQYYATGADYAADYGMYPGYGLYNGGTETSTTFNGLDAALSALAFLAFGVWLFNLVLPQLQVAGLGLPGLGRRIGQADDLVRPSGKDIDGIGNLFHVFSNSYQETVSNLLEGDKSIFRHIIDGEFVRNVENSLLSTLKKQIRNVLTLTGNALLKSIQNFWEPEAPEKTELKTDMKDVKLLTTKPSNYSQGIYRTHLTNTNSRLHPKSMKTSRWKRKIKVQGGRGILEDILGQVLKPLSFLAGLLSKNRNTDYHFPNSRTEIVEDNSIGWGDGLQEISRNSLEYSWNKKTYGNGAKYPEFSVDRGKSPKSSLVL